MSAITTISAKSATSHGHHEVEDDVGSVGGGGGIVVATTDVVVGVVGAEVVVVGVEGSGEGVGVADSVVRDGELVVGRGVGDGVGISEGEGEGDGGVALADVGEPAVGDSGDLDRLSERDGVGRLIDRETLGRLAPPSQETASTRASTSHRARLRIVLDVR